AERVGEKQERWNDGKREQTQPQSSQVSPSPPSFVLSVCLSDTVDSSAARKPIPSAYSFRGAPGTPFRNSSNTTRGNNRCSTASTRAASVSGVSPERTGTGHWAMIGPWSYCSST